MKWNRESLLFSSNQKEFDQAIKDVLEIFSDELRKLYNNYNKVSSIHYGRNVRDKVRKFDDKKVELIDFSNELKYNAKNKKLLVERLELLFDELEHLSEMILEAHKKSAENHLDTETQISNITTQIKSIQKEINNLSQRNDKINSELYLNYESKIERTINDLKNAVDSSLKEISGYKSEIELGKNYREMIKIQFENASKNVRTYFVYFIISIALLTSILITPSIVRDWTDYNAQIGWRISIGLPLLWLVSFVFTHYKYYKVTQLKYQHILNLLGGGAYYIGKLLENKSARELANSRIIEMLLEYKDLSNLFYKEKAPMDKYLKKALEIIKESKKIIEENNTHNKG
jgi:hypothetical protein